MAVKESSASKIKFKGVDALFGLSEEQECVREIPLDELDTFKNHPFKVFRDDKMEEMIESISEYGVLVPGIARPSNSGEKDYELVVGHRRKYACRELGLKTMPVIIRDMSDDEATVVMVDSNIQRENLLYSEKAFAYRMKYEALKRQGRRTDLTLVQVEPKLKKRWAAEMVGTEVGETMSTIKRYIRLTYLSNYLLEFVDKNELPVFRHKKRGRLAIFVFASLPLIKLIFYLSMIYRIKTYIALITYTGIMILPINAPMMTLNAAIPSVAVVSIPLGIRINRILCIPNGNPSINIHQNQSVCPLTFIIVFVIQNQNTINISGRIDFLITSPIVISFVLLSNLFIFCTLEIYA